MAKKDTDQAHGQEDTDQANGQGVPIGRLAGFSVTYQG